MTSLHVTMSVGNLLSYFGSTPMQVLLFIGMPYLAALLWCFVRFQPHCASGSLYSNYHNAIGRLSNPSQVPANAVAEGKKHT
jgi:hypothetical protein